ncbi:MAG: alpha/beta fold hydrolase [Anaerolineae bacterium]|nr:alpha/beta fold hydrolase [Anaerolineae bacterium]
MNRNPLLPVVMIAAASLACNFPGIARDAAAAPVTAPPVLPVASPGQPVTVPPPAPLPPTATEQPAYTPVFEPGACLFSVPGGYRVDCGWLVVPQDRAAPDQKSIRLHVAIFRSPSPVPAPDPLVFLSGGPGSSALGLAAYTLNSAGLDAVLASRDVILFDQRGVGYSDPALTCPEREDLVAALLTQRLSVEEQSALQVEAYAQCRTRYEAQGIDMADYTSAASAADIADLRRALGFDQYNLYGVSYGTRLALTVLRDHPEGLRSTVLDSVYPPQINLYTEWTRNADRAFNTLFETCAADPACAVAYPDLRGTFYRLVDRLNGEPLTVPVTDYAGQSHDVVLDGRLLIDSLFLAFYRYDNIPTLPAMIAAVDRGDTSHLLLQRMLQLNFDRSASRGMQAAVQCAEEVAFSSTDDLNALAVGVTPQVADTWVNELLPFYAVCGSLGLPAPDPRENQPVTGTVPVLILTGRFDPITPPEWGGLTAQTLPNSTIYEFPAAGHWIGRSSPCAVTIATSFVNYPDQPPDAGCLAGLGAPTFR